jgi:hypothetical protein
VLCGSEDVVKFRVYSLLAKISCISSAHHTMLESTDLLFFMAAFDADDLLTTLNTIEIYTMVNKYNTDGPNKIWRPVPGKDGCH